MPGAGRFGSGWVIAALRNVVSLVRSSVRALLRSDSDGVLSELCVSGPRLSDPRGFQDEGVAFTASQEP